jgi:hypothetical protein
VAGTCDDGSLIGSANTGVGSGTQPVYLPGRVFFTEGYGGAPYGLSIVVPARVGPFDLGTVVVRAQVFVDRTTAALRVISDPLPTILQGIPLRMRDIRIAVDRPGFIIGATNCAARAITATVTSTDGAVATASTPIQATGCGALPFRPVVKATTNGRRWKGSGASLDVSITQPAGQSNLGGVAVRLPAALAARGSTIKHACAYADWSAGRCDPSTRAGTATATTPILPQPLTAGVYFVTRPSGQAGLPQLRMLLQGNGLTIALSGDVVVGRDQRTTTTFSGIPDVPISAFSLSLPQGPNSLLDANQPLCQASPTLATTLTGQNGARRSQLVRIAVANCKKAKQSKTSTGSKSGKRAT